LRIALVAPLVSRIDDARPPLGGAQVIVADLARTLASRGHDVTLLAATGSRVRGARTPDIGIDASRLAPADLTASEGRADDASQRGGFGAVRSWIDGHPGEWDVVHAHAYDAPAFDALRGLAPVVHTLHLAPLDGAVVAAAGAAAASGAVLASVSHANARAWTAAGARVSEILPNGIDVEAIPFGARADGPLLFAGRMSPEKGPEVAIRAARAAGRTIVLAGGVYDRDHFTREVEPLLGPDARYRGALPRLELYELMARAPAVLMPVRWDEPFGLVAVEAQAAGAPVVAFERGGLPELIVAGRTGILVPRDDEAAFTAAIARTDRIDRGACRTNAGRFTILRMAEAHERLYARLGASGRNVSSRS
jgi:glycosyltransferase involved in cell wall biosynthesis